MLEPVVMQTQKKEKTIWTTDSFVTYLKLEIILGAYLLKCLTEQLGIKEKIAPSRNVFLRPSFYFIVALSLVRHYGYYV
jgi:hypothetical protein